ncbi:helix-turn-helix domain-containing protein, partial [Lysinibacillus sp. GbtcB16]|uniref:helix-turn-helix domain-containing protein n=1 Tax=Lysinibacillus sp. GbtcB16 TaxID=2824761 RepID=UPI001C30954D
AMTGLRPSAITNICRDNLERVQLDHISKIATALGITDIREIMTLVEVSEAEWFNMANSLGVGEDDDQE